MKIIFLDIDGVLNSRETFLKNNRNNVKNCLIDCPDIQHLKHLNVILDETRANIVISSTWRKLGELSLLSPFLYKCGLTTNVDIIGTTPTEKHGYRGLEIIGWLLKANDATNDFPIVNEPIDNICILDDDSDVGKLLPWLVQTTFEHGLCENHIQKAIDVLNKPFPDFIYSMRDKVTYNNTKNKKGE